VKKDNGETDQHNEAKPRIIDVRLMDLKVLSGLGWDAVEETNKPPLLFRHGGVPSRLERNDEGVPILRQLTPDRLRHEVARRAVWCNGKSRAKPPVDVVKDMLATPDPPLPILTRITEIPVFAPDGTLQTEPGYHKASKTLYEPQDGFTVAAIPVNPTSEAIEKAKTLILDELLFDFPFAGDGGKAHAVSLFLLPFVRSLISGPTPLHLIESPTPGSGKGLLADVLLSPAVGSRTVVMAQAKDGDEWRKRITAFLMKAPEVILIDNVTIPLDSGELSAALTTGYWSDRLLGKSQMVPDIPVRCVWVTTANNPVMSTEIARRTIRIRLEPDSAKPWTLTEFKHQHLREWAKAHRQELVHAGLTISKAWIVSGKPHWTKSQRLGSFEEWSGTMGGILESIGISGFLSDLDAFYEVSDIETATLELFVQAWWQKLGDKAVGVGKLLPLAQESGLVVTEKSRQSQLVSLGTKLRKQRDRVIGEWRVVWAGKKQGAIRWRLLKRGE